MKTMKKTLAVVLMAVMVLTVASAAYAAVNIYTTGKVNLRKGPGPAYASVVHIPKGTNLTATSRWLDDRGVQWYKVEYKGKTGWISSVYAKYGYAPGTKDTVIATGNTHIRSKAGLNGAKLGTLHKGNYALYLNKSSEDDRGVQWYKIYYNGLTGWVSSKNVKVK